MTEYQNIMQALSYFDDGGEKPEDCPCEFAVRGGVGCEKNLAKAIKKMLEIQKPVKPIFDDKSNRMLGVWKCGNCKMVMAAAATHVHFCWCCGHPVDWEEYQRDRIHELADNAKPILIHEKIK